MRLRTGKTTEKIQIYQKEYVESGMLRHVGSQRAEVCSKVVQMWTRARSLCEPTPDSGTSYQALLASTDNKRKRSKGH